MPQLDRIIIFSQIFWLFIIFTMLYTTLTHFFLPKFIKSLKSRKQVIEQNSLEITQAIINVSQKQHLLQKTLVKNLNSIKTVVTENLNSSLTPSKKFNTMELDKKISLAVFNTIKYCDSQSLDFIILCPKSLNLNT